MFKLDPYELEVFQAYESGKLKFAASKAELLRMPAAALATAIKDMQVNIRLSSIAPGRHRAMSMPASIRSWKRRQRSVPNCRETMCAGLSRCRTPGPFP